MVISSWSSQSSSPCGSSSDFESNEEDFIAELTRQMAECMLQEEEEDEKVMNYVCQVYELKNQPPVSKEGHFCRGRRVKGTESTQQKQLKKTQQDYYRPRQYRGRNGSGMQAVFLGGSGPRNGPPGTGVFLPRPTSDPTDLKKKSGCSIVLMPTRVLQALELHFKQRHHSTVPSLSGGSLIQSRPKEKVDHASDDLFRI
ncbi:hypothetical protein PHJA_000392000 [Phtheirospermum japonicum]|uniref:Uncharacterized protein n=1 Tax=Phtheirospermum japonicum TaxID=374723 RepID=A0A830B4A4_9LAMI|nr:hypothetical protein PHJA_000392000 [Phtheirospermum japonicum]